MEGYSYRELDHNPLFQRVYDMKEAISEMESLELPLSPDERRDMEALAKKTGWDSQRTRCHHDYILTQRILNNGTLCCYAQCIKCGNCHPVKKPKHIDRLPMCCTEFRDVKNTLSRVAWLLSNTDLAEMENRQNRHSIQDARVRAYKEHLKSTKWAELRKKVIARCGNVCEGCGCAPVENVHHLTYANVGDELLFQLVGLCRNCHKKAHKLESE